MKIRIASLTLFCLVLAVVPASAQNHLYSNGPINGNADAWIINFGYVVSDSFYLGSAATATGFDFGVWEYPGDTISSVGWAIGRSAGSSDIAHGTASGSSLSEQFISTDQYGYSIDMISVSGLNVQLAAGTYWLSLANAVVWSGDPVYWDENSGPSAARFAAPNALATPPEGGGIGTIPSEAFDINGATCIGCGCYADGRTCKPDSTPEPGSILLLGSGIVALAGVLRRTLF